MKTRTRLETPTRRVTALAGLVATSLMMMVSGTPSASAGDGGTSSTSEQATAGADSNTITVKVWGNGVKAQPTGSGDGVSWELPMPAACWMAQGETGKDYADYVDTGQLARYNANHPEDSTDPIEGYKEYKDDVTGHWYFGYWDPSNWPNQSDQAGWVKFSQQYTAAHPYRYFLASDPAPQLPDVPVEQLRDFALSQLELPEPELNWNPKIAGNHGTLVNLRTWLWLDNAPQSLKVHASIRSGTQASVTATFDGMDITAPGETGFSCRDSGTPYAVGASTNCSLAFSRSSSALGVPKTTVTVATKWTATWEGTGVTQQPLTPSPTTDAVDTDIRVDEVQTLVTGTG
jgi:hypothetical protein